jgi:2,4-dienoyl-CoA reductase-like NADH-dependent reductase (Old Yellow Enzyme family)/thioredoxin reductase
MNKYYPKLFEPMTIKTTTFKNRLFSAPNMCSWTTTDQRPDDNFIKWIETKAAGGVAQVTVAGGMVDADICELGGGFWIPGRRLQPRMTELVKAIHQHNCVASLELCHGGGSYPVDKFGRNPVAPSAYVRWDGQQVDEITVERMNEIADHYAEYAKVAQICGFDGVMLHGAHGWGLAQFMSDEFNKRTDEYGGCMENRARFPLMVINRVREACGDNFLIEYRISGDEFCPQTGGHTLEDTIEFLKYIDDAVDIIHVSAGRDSTDDGAVITHPTIFRKNGCNAYLAAEIKKHVKSPVVTLGAINTPELAEEILENGGADFIAGARTFIADPAFANKARRGHADDIIPCIRCLSCLTGLQETDAANCSVNPRTYREARLASQPEPSEKLDVIVVGGGAGGMQAAVTASERGHNVTLIEKTDKLGGTINFTDHDELKVDLRRFKNYLVNQVNKHNIKVMYNTEATPELINQLAPDALIVAAGSTPIKPRIPGLDEYARHVLTVYNDLDSVGKKVVMVGGGLAGCETGIFLAELGHEVEIVEMLPELARDANWMSQEGMKVPMEKYHIGVHTSSTCLEVLPNGVRVKNPDGSESILEADSVIYGLGMRANSATVEALRDCADEFVAVGDCVRARKVPNAVHEGYFAALDLGC